MYVFILDLGQIKSFFILKSQKIALIPQVRRTRNDLAHIHDNMEMSKSELQTYIQRMVDLLKTVHKSPNAILTVKEIQKVI